MSESTQAREGTDRVGRGDPRATAAGLTDAVETLRRDQRSLPAQRETDQCDQRCSEPVLGAPPVEGCLPEERDADGMIRRDDPVTTV
jgi:hypothetical protein